MFYRDFCHWEKPYIFTCKNTIFLRVKISANQKSSFVAMFSCLGMDNSSVYIINRILHGRLEIWNLSSSVHIWYLTRSLRSLVRCQCEHSKINSISSRAHVLFSIYADFFCYFSLGKISLFNEVKVKSAYEPSGSPGRSLSRTRNIATTPSIKFAGTHLYTWVDRGTVRVKCLAQEHNTMFPARARTRTARSEVELTKHEATAPPTSLFNSYS